MIARRGGADHRPERVTLVGVGKSATRGMHELTTKGLNARMFGRLKVAAPVALGAALLMSTGVVPASADPCLVTVELVGGKSLTFTVDAWQRFASGLK